MSDSIGYIEFLASPCYPWLAKTFTGWLLMNAMMSGNAPNVNALISSDGFVLRDVNGLILIPKEAK